MAMRNKITHLVLVIFIFAGCKTEVHHPLVVSNVNPRYFTDGSGKVIYLTGSHTWNNLVDMTHGDQSQKFDYPAYLELLKRYNVILK